MAYYERSDSYYDYDDYHSDSRRNSNSFSEEINGPKRKKTNWGGRGRGGNRKRFGRGVGDRNASPRSVTVDTPLFQEPRRTPPSARRMPQPPSEDRKRGRERNNSFRSNTKPYFDIREMPEFVEAEHSGPSWHWDTYVRGCKNWQDKHKLAYYQSRCTALEFENQMLFEQINKLIKENIVFAAERGRTPTMEVPEIPGFTRQETRASSTKNQEKEKLKKAEKVEARPKSEDTPKGAAQKRKEDLEKLYGKNSALIHGLETSLLLNFNRNCDTYKPEMYPAVPLNSEAVVA